MTELYVNAGDIFDPVRLAEIASFPEWTSPDLEKARKELEELYEKREALIKEGMDRNNTRYHWTSYVLRRLGFCFSAVEQTPGETEMRPDFTLFYDSTEFMRARDYRGQREFFSHASAVMRTLGWEDSLDEVEYEGQTFNPALDLDRYMRATGLEWGVLTNGRTWRLFHRDTSGLLNNFFEVDLVHALESTQMDAFKYFWTVFSPAGLGSTAGDAVVNRLLN
jgi:hypothetical protein